jgi:Domain of unknown function (DUF1992)
MSFDRIVEAIIQDAMERGEFEDLPGKGKPIDLTGYFDTPEEVRLAHSILKNAGMAPREVDLLKEIGELRQILSALLDEETGNPRPDRDKAGRVQPDDGTAKAAEKAKVS